MCHRREPEVHPYLLEADNAILAPHVAALTRKTIGNVEIELADTVESYLETGTPDRAVNKPVDK
jgi:phosphoglycerate dehydrogenase-like enzyme